MALMDHYKDSLDLSTEAINSSGQAMQRYQTYAESTKARIQDLEGSIQRFWQQTLQSSTINSVVGGLNSLVNTFASITNKFGVLPTLATAILPILTQFGKFKDFKLVDFTSSAASATKFTQQVSILGTTLETIGNKFKTSFGSFGDNYSKNLSEIQGLNTTLNQTPTFLEKASASMKTLRETTVATTVATGALRLAEVALNASLTMGLSLAIGYIVEKLSDWINKDEILAQKNQDLLSSTNQSIQGHQSNVQSLSEMSDKYKEVYDRVQAYKEKGLQPLTEDQNSLNQMNDQLSQKFPNLINGYTDTGHAVLNLNGDLKNLIETEKEAAKANAQKAIDNGGFKEQSDNESQRAKDRIKELSGTWSWGDTFKMDFTHPIQTLKDSFANSSQSSAMIKQLNNQIEESGKWYQKIIPYILQVNDGYSKLNPTLQTTIKNWANQNTAFSKMSGQDVQKQVNSVISMYSSNKSLPLINQINTLTNQAKLGAVSIKDYKTQTSSLIQQLQKISGTKLSTSDLQKIFNIDTSKLPKSEADVKAFTKSVDEMKEDLKNDATQIKQYEKILEDIKSTGKLSDSNRKILETDPTLIPYLNNVNDLTGALSGKIKDLKQSATGTFAGMQLKQEQENLENLLDTYNNLHGKQGLSTEDQKKLSDAIQELQGNVQGLTVSTDTDGQATIESLDPIKNKITALGAEGQYLQLVAQIGVTKANERLKSELQEAQNVSNASKSRMQTYASEIASIQTLIVAIKGIPLVGGIVGDALDKKLSTVKGYYNYEKGIMDKADNNIKSLQSQITAEPQGQADWNKYLNQSNNILNSLGSTTDNAGKTEQNFTTDTDGNTKATKKNTEAQKAQKAIIDEVKEKTKEYETELKNLDNIQNKLEVDLKHMDKTSEEYRQGLQQEIDLLKKKNGFLQKGINLNNSSIGTLGGYASGAGSQMGEEAVQIAEQYQGVPYVWSGTDPSGFDCSGLVQYVYKQLGIELDRTSQEQINDGTAVSKNELQPGDLVFFGDPSAPHHVGIYVGGDEYIQAPKTGDVVKISDLSARDDYAGARRVVSGSSSSSTSTSSVPSEMTYQEIVDAAASKYGVDANLIAAVIDQESSWDTSSKSSAGAVGLMQLMAGTAESMGLSADQRTDPIKNVMAGTQYLAGLINKYGEEKGVALYNTGEYGGGNYGYANSVESKKSAYASGSKSIPGGSVSTSGDTDVLSEMDSLNSKTADYQKQMIDNQSIILDLYTEKYNSQLDAFKAQIDSYTKLQEYNKNQYDLLRETDFTSADKYAKAEWQDENDIYATLTKKEAFIRDQQKQTVYDKATLAQMKTDLLDTQEQEVETINKLHDEFTEWQDNALIDATKHYKDQLTEIQAQMDLIETKDKSNYQDELDLNKQELDQQEEIKARTEERLQSIQALINVEKYDTTKQILIDEYNKIHNELLTINKDIASINNSINGLKIDVKIAPYQEDIKQLEAELDKYNDLTDSSRANNELEPNYDNRMDDITKIIGDIQNEVSVYTNNIKKLQSVQTRFNEDSEEYRDLQDQINDLLDKRNELDKSSLDYAKKKEELQENQLLNTAEQAVYEGQTQQEFEDNAKARENAIDAQLKAMDKQEQNLEEQETRNKNLLDLEEARVKLQQDQSNRNVQQLTKDKNGNWQFTYVANQETVDQDEKDMRDKMQSNNDWERQNKQKHDQDALNDEKEQLEQEVSIRQETMERIKTNLENAFNDQHNLFENGKTDTVKIVQDTMDQIKSIYNEYPAITQKVTDDLQNKLDIIGGYNSQFVASQHNINDVINPSTYHDIKDVYGSGADLNAAKAILGSKDFNYVNIDKDHMTDEQRQALKLTNHDILLGGDSVLYGVDPGQATRLYGNDRNATAEQITRYGIQNGETFVAFGSGQDIINAQSRYGDNYYLIDISSLSEKDKEELKLQSGDRLLGAAANQVNPGQATVLQGKDRQDTAQKILQDSEGIVSGQIRILTDGGQDYANAIRNFNSSLFKVIDTTSKDFDASKININGTDILMGGLLNSQLTNQASSVGAQWLFGQDSNETLRKVLDYKNKIGTSVTKKRNIYSMGGKDYQNAIAEVGNDTDNFNVIDMTSKDFDASKVQFTSDDWVMGGNGVFANNKDLLQKIISSNATRFDGQTAEDTKNKLITTLDGNLDIQKRYERSVTENKKSETDKQTVIIKNANTGQTETIETSAKANLAAVTNSMTGITDITNDKMGNMVITVNKDVEEAKQAFQSLLSSEGEMTSKPTVQAEGIDAKILRAQYGDAIQITNGKGYSGKPGSDRYSTNKEYQEYLSQYGLTAKDVGSLYNFKETEQELQRDRSQDKDNVGKYYQDVTKTTKSSTNEQTLIIKDASTNQMYQVKLGADTNLNTVTESMTNINNVTRTGMNEVTVTIANNVQQSIDDINKLLQAESMAGINITPTTAQQAGNVDNRPIVHAISHDAAILQAQYGSSIIIDQDTRQFAGADRIATNQLYQQYLTGKGVYPTTIIPTSDFNKYENGGLVNYTGLAQLDGTPSKPEMVLNPDDTSNMFKIVQSARDLMRGIDVDKTSILSQTIPDLIPNLIKSIPNIENLSKNQQSASISNTYKIDHLNFPNVTKSQEIVSALTSLNGRVDSYMSSYVNGH